MTPEALALEKQRKPERIASIDILRGLAMILMALDHTRSYFGPTPFDPIDPEWTSPGWFVTRWVTHFCAPVFVFLAGTSAYMVYHRGMSKSELSRRLITRGMWLIFAEVTIIAAGWGFLFVGMWMLQVIWAIGVSMIVLALLIHLPVSIIGAIGIGMIGWHNLLDVWSPKTENQVIQDVWTVLHVKQPVLSLGMNSFGAPRVFVVYPLIPWIGVMAFGYRFGALLVGSKRDRVCLATGSVMIAMFVLIRAFGAYGDTSVWALNTQTGIMGFLNTQKYPPSLLFILMTLGPAILCMPLLDRVARVVPRLVEPVRVFGNVAMLYYVLHIPLTHLSAGIWSLIHYKSWIGWVFMGSYPESYEPSLWVVYISWALIVLALYPVCLLYAKLRKRKRYWWMTYI